MTPDLPLAGRRYLVAAEYVGYGGTREYFKDLLSFYYDNGAFVVAVTSFPDTDPQMVSFANDRGFELIRYRDMLSRLDRASARIRPAVWSRSIYSREVELFQRLYSQHGLNGVTLSVGTSGLFLSAAAAHSEPLMIAHGYPHGLRQKLLGKSLLAPLVPPNATILAVSEYSARLFQEAWNRRSRKPRIGFLRSTCGPRMPWIPLDQRQPIVLTAALVEEYKRPFDWVKVATQVISGSEDSPEPEFLWLGEGSLRQQATSRIPQSLRQRVTFPGWSDATTPHYQRARIYLQTSSKEALGLSVVDALRFGLPSVVTDAGGLPEVVLDGVNGFVVPVGDTQGAAQAVRALLHDDVLWQKQARAAHELYEERFSPEAWEAELLAAHQRSR